MQKSNKFAVLLLFLFCLSSVQTFSADKNKIYSSIKKKYSDIHSLQLKFYDPVSSVKGELLASDNNKYVINLFGRTIYSDGNTIWNYSARDSNVLISSFNSFDSELSVESLFFELLENFEPEKLTDFSSSAGVSGYKLYLNPKKTYSNPNNIKYIELIINKADYQIEEIIYKQDYSEYRWRISDLKINPEVKESDFRFINKEGIEVIDLR